MTLLDWQISDYPQAESEIRNIPLLFDADNPASLDHQLASIHPGIEPAPPSFFSLSFDFCLLKEEMPPLQPIAQASHLGERIFIYPAGFIVILQLNQSFKAYRLI